MSEYTEVEQPFLQQLAGRGWTVIDQGAAGLGGGARRPELAGSALADRSRSRRLAC